MKNISIIIPCCNFEMLKNCVNSIIRNTDLEKHDIEVIVSLNGCDIAAIDYIRSLGDRFRFIWIDCRVGLCTSANLAGLICDGNYIIRMDEDVVILDWGKDIWIDMLLNSFIEKVGQVGVVCHDWPNSEYKSVVGFLTMTTKKIWDEVGGWNEEFDKMTLEMGEDTDFSIKIQKLGYEVVQVGNHILTGELRLPFTGNFPVQHSSNGSWRV